MWSLTDVDLNLTSASYYLSSSGASLFIYKIIRIIIVIIINISQDVYEHEGNMRRTESNLWLSKIEPTAVLGDSLMVFIFVIIEVILLILLSGGGVWTSVGRQWDLS